MQAEKPNVGPKRLRLGPRPDVDVRITAWRLGSESKSLPARGPSPRAPLRNPDSGEAARGGSSMNWSCTRQASGRISGCYRLVDRAGRRGSEGAGPDAEAPGTDG